MKVSSPPHGDFDRTTTSGSSASTGSSALVETAAKRKKGGRKKGKHPKGQPGPIDAQQLWEDVRSWLSRFIVFMNEDDLNATTAWVIHTYLANETYTTPRLLIDSPLPSSGKTTLLEHLERLCFHPIRAASLGSAALITRILQEGPRTILIDEADRSLAPDRQQAGELLAVLNSGYKQGATRPVLEPVKDQGWKPVELPTFAPVAMAGNNPRLPDDTMSRCIRILLLPDREDQAEESDWEFIEEEGRQLAQRISDWADSVRETVKQTRADLPAGVRGRARERWAPLKRIAMAAGGPWPAVIDDLARKDVERIEAEREEGLLLERPGVVLLRDIYSVWDEEEEPFLATEELIERLEDHNPEMWRDDSKGPLTPQRLGRMLVTSFGIHSDRSSKGRRKRGYRRRQFSQAFTSLGLTQLPE